MFKRPRIWLATPLALAALILGAAPAAAADTVRVSPKHMHGWAFFDDNTGGPGTGRMVTGPGDPPLGEGSAQIAVSAPSDRQALGTLAYKGTAVADITTLSYWSYQADAAHAMPLQFDIHDAAAKYHRLVFEPGYGNGVIVGNKWQKWAPLSGRWWVTRPNGGLCSQATPCSWAQIKAAYPGSSISGATLFKAGGGWLPWTGTVDAFTIGTRSADVTTYDFEPANRSNQSDDSDDEVDG